MNKELFFDNKLIQKKSNIQTIISRPKKVSIDLPITPQHAYFSFFQDNGLYHLYFKETLLADGKQLKERTFLSQSEDGLHFTSPKEILRGKISHNFFPLPSPEGYLGIGEYQSMVYPDYPGLSLFRSENGEDWKREQLLFNRRNTLPSQDPKLSCCDTLNNLIFDGEAYRFFLRYNLKRGTRRLQTCQTQDFLTFTPMEAVQFTNWDPGWDMSLYTPNISLYPGGNFFIGLPTLQHENDHSTHHTGLMFSRNGEEWTFLSKNLFSSLEIPFSAAAGILSSPDALAFYVQEGSRFYQMRYRQDGLFSLYSERGGILTQPLALSHLSLNYDTGSQGKIEVTLVDTSDHKEHKLGCYQGDRLNHTLLFPPGRYQVNIQLHQAKLYSLTYEE